MTILFDKIIHEFDPDPKFAEYDRAQPVAALEYMQDTSNDDGAIVDCFVDLEPNWLEY